MARTQETFSKKEKEKKRLKKRQEKLAKREERKANSGTGDLDSMMAYVDENGMIVDTPPDPNVKKKVIKASSIEIGVPKREAVDTDIENRGKVTFFNTSKGYGFIKDMSTQESYFVHVNGLLEEIQENDIVNFELERGQKGMNAVRVKIYKEKEEVPAPKAEADKEASDSDKDGAAAEEE
ncbi:cold shock domain-containing protein [Putridiphycobacter roseus]|uniref:Cold shock domain-containing protein n=1 Tax=Putridiphycobacter roseus TaxID=2219161 RepID=A0A2W1N1R5_9FLAO|nr:cold shock domain-containing protein [Putridiphycobacter roseus]PZE17500.1 cold shock domain-containing protein [Putridiphycobacter roseus]